MAISDGTWCEYCFSEKPVQRKMVHAGDCLLNVAWDIEDTRCTCHKAYRCRSKFHRVEKKVADGE